MPGDAAFWDSGIGAEKLGGRWNAKGQRAVYSSVDPSTAILEVAVHTGFPVLDTQAHVLTCREITRGPIYVVQPKDVPNPAWLVPGTPSAGQRAYGSQLLAQHGMVMFPSAVSRFSWNLVLEPNVAKGRYHSLSQASFALDTRLHPSRPRAEATERANFVDCLVSIYARATSDGISPDITPFDSQIHSEVLLQSLGSDRSRIRI